MQSPTKSPLKVTRKLGEKSNVLGSGASPDRAGGEGAAGPDGSNEDDAGPSDLQKPKQMSNMQQYEASLSPAKLAHHQQLEKGKGKSKEPRIRTPEQPPHSNVTTPLANVGWAGAAKYAEGARMDALQQQDDVDDANMDGQGHGAAEKEGPQRELTEEELYPEIEYMPPSDWAYSESAARSPLIDDLIFASDGPLAHIHRAFLPFLPHPGPAAHCPLPHPTDPPEDRPLGLEDVPPMSELVETLQSVKFVGYVTPAQVRAAREAAQAAGEYWMPSEDELRSTTAAPSEQEELLRELSAIKGGLGLGRDKRNAAAMQGVLLESDEEEDFDLERFLLARKDGASVEKAREMAFAKEPAASLPAALAKMHATTAVPSAGAAPLRKPVSAPANRKPIVRSTPVGGLSRPGASASTRPAPGSSTAASSKLKSATSTVASAARPAAPSATSTRTSTGVPARRPITTAATRAAPASSTTPRPKSTTATSNARPAASSAPSASVKRPLGTVGNTRTPLSARPGIASSSSGGAGKPVLLAKSPANKSSSAAGLKSAVAGMSASKGKGKVYYDERNDALSKLCEEKCREADAAASHDNMFQISSADLALLDV